MSFFCALLPSALTCSGSTPPDISITRDVSTNSWAALVCRSGDVWVTVERILATARIRIGSPGRDRIYKANLARRSWGKKSFPSAGTRKAAKPILRWNTARQGADCFPRRSTEACSSYKVRDIIRRPALDCISSMQDDRLRMVMHARP